MNQLIEIDRTFRDAESKIPNDQVEAHNRTVYEYVRQLSNSPATGDDALTLTEVLEFCKVVNQEGDTLRGFFERKSPDAPSSLESSTVLTFCE